MVTHSTSFSASKTAQPTPAKAKDSGTAVKKATKKKTDDILISTEAPKEVMDLSNDDKFPQLTTDPPHTTVAVTTPSAASNSCPSSTSALSRQDSAPISTDPIDHSPPLPPQNNQHHFLWLLKLHPRDTMVHQLANPFAFTSTCTLSPNIH